MLSVPNPACAREEGRGTPAGGRVSGRPGGAGGRCPGLGPGRDGAAGALPSRDGTDLGKPLAPAAYCTVRSTVRASTAAPVAIASTRAQDENGASVM